MTDKQKEQLAVQKAVMEVMEKHLTRWQSVTALKKKYDQFVRNIKKIDDYDTILRTSYGHLKEKRIESNKELLEKLFPVTSVLGVFASDTGDKKLEKLTNVKYSRLENMKHDALVKYSARVLKVTRPLIEQSPEAGKTGPKHVITDYGLTFRYLDGLQAALENSIRDETAYREFRVRKNKSKKKLKRRIRENKELLNKKLDRMMHLFRDTQKSFYSAYIKSRIPAKRKPSEAAVNEPVSKPE